MRRLHWHHRTNGPLDRSVWSSPVGLCRKQAAGFELLWRWYIPGPKSHVNIVTCWKVFFKSVYLGCGQAVYSIENVTQQWCWKYHLRFQYHSMPNGIEKRIFNFIENHPTSNGIQLHQGSWHARPNFLTGFNTGTFKELLRTFWPWRYDLLY